MPAPSETVLERVLVSGGCRRLALALLCLVGIVFLTVALVLSFVPTWEGVGDPALHPLAILVDPAHPTTVYAATEQGVVMVTRDNGASWATYHAGLPPNAVMAALLALPGDGHLLAGTDHGIFVTSDGGYTWAAQGSGLPTTLTVDALAAVTPDMRTLLAGGTTGLYRSTDGGQTWNSATAGLPTGSAVYGLDTMLGALFAALIPGGIYASTDGGLTWSPRTQGLPANVNAFAIVSASPMRLYTGTSLGVYRSMDGGVTWTASSAGLGASNRVISLAVDPLSPAHLVAGTDTGVFRSTDGGMNWTRLGGLPTPPGQSVGVVALAHPTSGATVYYAAADQPYRYHQAPNNIRTILQGISILADVALLGVLALLGIHLYLAKR